MFAKDGWTVAIAHGRALRGKGNRVRQTGVAGGRRGNYRRVCGGEKARSLTVVHIQPGVGDGLRQHEERGHTGAARPELLRKHCTDVWMIYAATTQPPGLH